MPHISSRQNPLIKQLIELRDDRNSGRLFLEGPRLLQEVLKTKLPIEMLIWTASAEGDPVLEKAKASAKELFTVSDSVFEAVSDVKTPQGFLAIAQAPRWTWNDVLGKTPAPILVIDGVQDPGNVSTMVRTAEAAGAAAVVTTPGTARLLTPKALRSAAGSTLRLPLLEHLSVVTIAEALRNAGYQILAAVAPIPGAEMIPYTEASLTKPVAFLLGQEGQGLSQSWDSLVDHFVGIPMSETVESLNVSAAAAIFLFEAKRQRDLRV